MGYKKDAIKGISWLGFFRVATRGVSYVRIAILARLLTPLQFGAADIALLILGITEIFTETGVNIFLVQEKENIDKYISTAWIVSILRGLLIASIIASCASFVAKFFNAPQVLQLLLFVSIVPIIRGLINPSVVKFSKELRFDKEFYYRTSIFIVEAVTSVLFVFSIHSPLAIVFGVIAGALFECTLSFFIATPRPHFVYNGNLFKKILNYGKWLTATGILNYLYHNGDNIAVGKLLGTSLLGIYQRAYSISMLPISEVSDVVLKVTFAVFVKISSDLHRLKIAYIKSILMVSAVVIPIGIIFFLFPRLIISIILGSQWLAAAPVLKVLAIFGAIRAISIASIAPFYALGRQELVTHITFIAFLGLAVSIVPFVLRWGILGAGYSALLGTLLSLPITIYYMNKIFKND